MIPVDAKFSLDNYRRLLSRPMTMKGKVLEKNLKMTSKSGLTKLLNISDRKTARCLCLYVYTSGSHLL